MQHNENARRNDDLLEEVKRLRSLTSLLTREKADLQQAIWNGQVAARASAEYVNQLGQQFERSYAHTRFLEEACKNKNIEIERLVKERLAAEEMVEHQRNGIDALNADFCALELKYVGLKRALHSPVPTPIAPPSPDDDGWEKVKLSYSEA